MEENEKYRVFISITLIIMAIMIFVVLIIFYNADKEESSKNLIGESVQLTNSLKNKIYNEVKKDIIDDLKSPSSAIFPKIEKWNIRTNSNNIVEVSSYVDSQNSYGAMLRANFKYQYIVISKEEYLCVCKEFDNKVEFDICKYSESDSIINKKVTKEQIDELINKANENMYNTIYKKTIDYKFDEVTQELIWNLEVTYNTEEELKNKCFLMLTAAIDECICFPTVKTTINVYINGENDSKKIVTVNNIDFQFMIEEWYSLCKNGLISSHNTTGLEEILGEKMLQDEIIKDKKVDYWNK